MTCTELSSRYGENTRAGPKAHLETVTERGRAHHREIHRVLAAVDIEVSITTTTSAAGHRSFPVLKVPAAGVSSSSALTKTGTWPLSPAMP